VKKSLYIFIIIIFSQSVAQSKKIKPDEMPLQYKGNVRYPEGYRLPTVQVRQFGDQNIKLKLYASRFAQGHALYIELIPEKNIFPVLASVQLYLRKSWVPLVKKKWGYRAIIAIVTYAKPGITYLNLIYKVNNRKYNSKFQFKISRTVYRVFRSSFAVKNLSDQSALSKPAVLRRRRKDNIIKRDAFRQTNVDSLTAKRSHPRNLHYVTSPFWSKRVYARYKIVNKKKKFLKPRVSRHGGLDLKGKKGKPVYAMLAGKVVISHDMYFNGKYILLDHGNKIFSGYMHQSRLLVKTGEIVKAGQLIGRVGATGAVTGPHLHVFVKIRGHFVAPLSVLPLPIRN